MAEVLAALERHPDAALRERFWHAVDIVERAVAVFGFDGLALSFNGGKDSTVLLHVVRAAYVQAAAAAAAANGAAGVVGGPAAANGVEAGAGAAAPAAAAGHAAAPAAAAASPPPPPPVRAIYFETPGQFPEEKEFTMSTSAAYNLQMCIYEGNFISGIRKLQEASAVRAIFIGTRANDPNAAGQEHFSPSSRGWPPFMRVNPLLTWTYRDVWAFLLAAGVPYCSLYDRGYTSIGAMANTVPNEALRASDGGAPAYRPAYELADESLERAGRSARAKDGARKPAPEADASGAVRAAAAGVPHASGAVPGSPPPPKRMAGAAAAPAGAAEPRRAAALVLIDRELLEGRGGGDESVSGAPSGGAGGAGAGASTTSAGELSIAELCRQMRRAGLVATRTVVVGSDAAAAEEVRRAAAADEESVVLVASGAAAGGSGAAAAPLAAAAGGAGAGGGAGGPAQNGSGAHPRVHAVLSLGPAAGGLTGRAALEAGWAALRAQLQSRPRIPA